MNLIKCILTFTVLIAFAKFGSSSAFKPAVKLPPEFLDDWPNLPEVIEKDPIVEENLDMTEVRYMSDEQGTSNKMRASSHQEIFS